MTDSRLAAEYAEVLQAGPADAQLAGEYVEVLQRILPPSALLVGEYVEVLQVIPAEPPPPPPPEPEPTPVGTITSKYQQSLWLETLAQAIDGAALLDAGGTPLTAITPVTMGVSGLQLVNTAPITLTAVGATHIGLYDGADLVLKLVWPGPVLANQLATGLTA